MFDLNPQYGLMWTVCCLFGPNISKEAHRTDSFLFEPKFPSAPRAPFPTCSSETALLKVMNDLLLVTKVENPVLVAPRSCSRFWHEWSFTPTLWVGITATALGSFHFHICCTELHLMPLESSGHHCSILHGSTVGSEHVQIYTILTLDNMLPENSGVPTCLLENTLKSHTNLYQVFKYLISGLNMRYIVWAIVYNILIQARERNHKQIHFVICFTTLSEHFSKVHKNLALCYASFAVSNNFQKPVKTMIVLIWAGEVSTGIKWAFQLHSCLRFLFRGPCSYIIYGKNARTFHS